MSLPKIFLKNKFIILLTLAFSLFLLTVQVQAMQYQAPPETGGYKYDYKKDVWEPAVESEEMNIQSWVNQVATDLSATVVDALGGRSESPGGGATGMISNLTMGMYATPPASSIEYLADLGQSLGLAKPAYAQGIGWTGFSPILPLWKLFRNIAYLAFVVIFILIGFMIMFRAKIDPQTAISVQQALPRIVVALLLVTFSYAIAGLMIDFGQLATRVVGNVFMQGKFIAVTDSEEESKTRLNDLLSDDIFKLVNPLRNVNTLVEKIGETGAIPEALEVPVLTSLTVKVIFWVAGFFIMFKIFFSLIGPYVGIILSIIFAPLLLLLGALPGQNALAGWLRSLLTNVLVFPVTFAMLALAATLMSNESLRECPVPESFALGPGSCWEVGEKEFGALWAPATIGPWGGVVGQLAGFGILFTIPKVVEMLQQAFKAPPAPWAGAAGEEIRAAARRIPFVGGMAG